MTTEQQHPATAHAASPLARAPRRRAIAELRPNPDNPRRVNEMKLATLVESIRRYGVEEGAPCAYQPIIVNRHPDALDLIVGGEMRWRAAQRAGYSEIWTRETYLDAEQLRELTIRLNVEAGEWDLEALEAASSGEQLALMGLDMAAERLATRSVPLAELVANPDNAREHGRRSVEAIAASLRRFGQQKPIVVQAGTNLVLAGHGTLAGAAALGWTEIAVVYSRLAGAEAAGYALADNRAAELSGWELEVLSEQLKMFESDPGGAAVADLGWAPHEAEPLLLADWTPAAPKPLEGFANEKRGAISISKEQRDALAPAFAAARDLMGEDAASEAACLIFICNEWLRDAEYAATKRIVGGGDAGGV